MVSGSIPSPSVSMLYAKGCSGAVSKFRLVIAWPLLAGKPDPTVAMVNPDAPFFVGSADA